MPGQHREQLGELPWVGILEQVREQVHVVRGVIRECGGRQGLLQFAQLVIAKDRAKRTEQLGPDRPQGLFPVSQELGLHAGQRLHRRRRGSPASPD